MESRVPVPTDNIFKFYALFGLLLVIFSFGALLYVSRSSNQLAFEVIPQLDALKQLAQPSRSDVLQMKLLERKLEISKQDKGFFICCCAVITVLGACGLGYGFSKWHTDVQPVLDRTAKVQLEIAELQLAKLRREVEAQQPQPKDANPTEAAQRSGS